MADEFLQIRAVGQGIRLNDAGVLLVDCSRGLSWSGQHVFTEPVQFSGAQQYLVEQIVDTNAVLGTVYWNNGLSIQKAIPSGSNKILMFDGSRVSWSALSIDRVNGVLSVGNGGTGLRKIARGEILFASESDCVKGLPPGVHGHALVMKHGVPEWDIVGNIRGETSTGFVPFSSSVNNLSNSTIFISGDTVELSGALKVGSNLVIASNANRVSIGNDEVHIILKKTGAFEIGAAKFNEHGVMTAGGVKADLIRGLIPVSQGGTGINSFAPGDILYANELGVLTRLSAPDGEGWVVGTNSAGLPAWIDMASVKIDGGYRRVKLETDGNTLFFINENKQRIALGGLNHHQHDSHLVTPVYTGGTGDDLSGVTRRGAIMVGRSRDAWTGLQPGPRGCVLSSTGPDSIPEWVEPPLTITGGIGLQIINKTISIDSNASISWSAPQHFESVKSNMIESDLLCLKVLRDAESPSVGSIWTDGDGVYVQTQRGKKSLVNSESGDANKHVIVLSLAQALNLSDIAVQSSRLGVCATIVPFSTSNPSSTTRWKLKRVDILPFALSSSIRLQLIRNGQEIFENHLEVHETQVGCVNFIESIFTSGDVLSLSAVVDSASGFLSATALLEEYHG